MTKYYKKIGLANLASDINAFEALRNSKIIGPIIDSVFSPLSTVSGSKCPGGSVKMLLESPKNEKPIKTIFYARNSCLSYDILNLATFYLDRLLGLFHYAPCVVRTLSNEEQLLAKFPQDLGGDRKDNFYDYKNHKDGSLTGLLCLDLSLKSSNEIRFPVLGQFTDGVVPPSEVQKSQIEYFILSILASIEPPYSNFKKNGVRETGGKKSNSDENDILTSFSGGNLEYKKYQSIVNFEHYKSYAQFLRQKPYFIHKLEYKTLQNEPISEPLTILRNCNFPKAIYDRLMQIKYSQCTLGNRIKMFTENSFGSSITFNFTGKLSDLSNDMIKNSKAIVKNDFEISISKRIDDNYDIFQNIVEKCLTAHGQLVFY